MNHPNPPHLQFVEPTNWPTIFKAWLKREGIRPEWQTVAKQKGWPSWTDWRQNWVKTLTPTKRQWFRYAIPDPLNTVPQFKIGPTQSWQKQFPANEQNHHNFATLITQTDYSTNPKIRSILQNFPTPTEFIGILLPDHSITLLEGHHRATALAIAEHQNLPLKFPCPPTITLTEFTQKEVILLTEMLNSGSSK